MRKVTYFVVIGLLVALLGCRGGGEPGTVEGVEEPGDGEPTVGTVTEAVEESGGAGSERVEQLLESGQAYLEAGEYAEAVRDLEAAVDEAPDNSDAHFLLGQAYNQSGQLSKAADEFRRVLELDPESAAAHHNLGVTFYQLEDLSSALDKFETALELDPDDPDTHYQLGATYLTLALSGSEPSAAVDPELLQQARGEFEAALALRENMPEALIGLGNIYLQQGDYDAAIQTLSQVIEVVPDSREAYYALGGAYAQSGDIDKACETYNEFLSLEPPAAWRTQAEQVMTSLGCE